MPDRPLDARIAALPRKWCITCERYLGDHPAVKTDPHFGGEDVEGGDVPVEDRLLELREAPAGSGIWLHRWLTGKMLHEYAERDGY